MQFVWRVHLAWLIHPLQPLFNERSPQQLGLYGFIFHLSLPFVLPHLQAVNFWSLFWMVLEKPITPALKGVSHQGEPSGIPLQPQWQLWSAVGSPVPCRVPPLCEEPGVLCIFCFPLPSPWFCILALNTETNFTFFFSWHFKAQPIFFWKWHTSSHSLLGKHKPFSPSQRYSCDYLSQSLEFFFLAKFCCYDVVCRHRRGDLAVHEVTLTVSVARCHLPRACSQCQNTQVALELRRIFKFVFYELPGHCETVWYHRIIWVEKASKIIESNCYLSTAKVTTNPWPQVPHQHIF